MFKVEVGCVEDYLAFDPARQSELEAFDGLMRQAAPRLLRYFHAGTAAGQPGMRFKMIGYGKFVYAASNGQSVEWPTVGLALQKNYISVYVAVEKKGRPLTDAYAGRLGALRMATARLQ